MKFITAMQIKQLYLILGLAFFCHQLTIAQSDPETIFNSACAACHGEDGLGRSASLVGFDIPLPDFTDCAFSSREAVGDWYSIVHEGGPIRSFNRMMPAFGDALKEEEILATLSHVKAFCKDKSWPQGEFNLPRPLFTEKAFPEDESVVTTTFENNAADAITSKFIYEKRFGARSMIEVTLPVGYQRTSLANDGKDIGIGDLGIGLKHTFYHDLDKGAIVSAGAEVIFPTGDEQDGFGSGTSVIEPFFTYGQILPGDAFFQMHAFAEFPTDSAHDDEAGLRLALGKTLTQGGFGRSWSPIIETLFSRDLVSGADTNVDIVPQFQMSLSTRQHILFNIGVRIPVNNRNDRDIQVGMYLIWDWFDGGLFDGW